MRGALIPFSPLLNYSRGEGIEYLYFISSKNLILFVFRNKEMVNPDSYALKIEGTWKKKISDKNPDFTYKKNWDSLQWEE